MKWEAPEVNHFLWWSKLLSAGSQKSLLQWILCTLYLSEAQPPSKASAGCSSELAFLHMRSSPLLPEGVQTPVLCPARSLSHFRDFITDWTAITVNLFKKKYHHTKGKWEVTVPCQKTRHFLVHRNLEFGDFPSSLFLRKSNSLGGAAKAL